MEYELVHEIQNQCRNNQMRDIFFEEIECADPVEYLKTRLKDKKVEMTVERFANGSVTVHASVDGLIEKFILTPF